MNRVVLLGLCISFSGFIYSMDSSKKALSDIEELRSVLPRYVVTQEKRSKKETVLQLHERKKRFRKDTKRVIKAVKVSKKASKGLSVGGKRGVYFGSQRTLKHGVKKSTMTSIPEDSRVCPTSSQRKTRQRVQRMRSSDTLVKKKTKTLAIFPHLESEKKERNEVGKEQRELLMKLTAVVIALKLYCSHMLIVPQIELVD